MSAECTKCGTDLMYHYDTMGFWCPLCAYRIAVEALEGIYFYDCGACEENSKVVNEALKKIKTLGDKCE